MPWSTKVTLVVLAALLALLYLLGPILTPFVVSAGLAYVGDPLVDRLERRKLSRTLAVCVVFVVFSAVGLLSLVLVVPMLQEQIATLVHNIPDYLRWVQDVGLPALGIMLPEGLRLDADGLKQLVAENWKEAGGFAREVLGQVSRSGMKLLGFAAMLLLVPVVTFYLLRDWDKLVHWVDDMVPRRHRDLVRRLARETDEVLGGFLRGQLLVMLGLGLIYSVGLWLAGLQLALLIGMGAGLVSFVPYLGFIVGLFTASLAMLVQTQELLPLAWILAAFTVGQVVESTLLTPLLVGDRIGLHPVTVIFAVMAGGQLFGFIGILLALPVAAVMAVMLRYAKSRWLESALYRGD